MQINEQLLILLDVIIAFILTGIVGYEREQAQKPAGFRTNMIIGGAAALMVSLGKSMILNFEQNLPATNFNVDPNRIIEAIVVGISFIGAGTILKRQEEDKVENLTTAATILIAAGIGISVALKNYALAIGVTFAIVVINVILRKLVDQK